MFTADQKAEFANAAVAQAQDALASFEAEAVAAGSQKPQDAEALVFSDKEIDDMFGNLS
jgi:hypothetical protein